MKNRLLATGWWVTFCVCTGVLAIFFYTAFYGDGH